MSALIGQTDGLRADGRHLLDGCGKREMRISLQVSRLEDGVHDRTPVRAGEAAAVVVEGEAVLALPSGQFERMREGIEA